MQFVTFKKALLSNNFAYQKRTQWYYDKTNGQERKLRKRVIMIVKHFYSALS